MALWSWFCLFVLLFFCLFCLFGFYLIILIFALDQQMVGLAWRKKTSAAK